MKDPDIDVLQQHLLSKLLNRNLPAGEQFCSCTSDHPWTLNSDPYNPFQCLKCRQGISPEKLHLPTLLLKEILDWNRVAEAIDQIGCHSNEYGEWVDAQKDSPASIRNSVGKGLAEQVAAIHACYFEYSFQVKINHPRVEFVPMRRCPICQNNLRRMWPTGDDEVAGDILVCDVCFISTIGVEN